MHSNPGHAPAGEPHAYRLTVGLALTAVLLVCGAAATPAGGSVDLGVAGRRNANATVVAEGRLVVIAWGAAAEDGATDIYVATSRDAGGSFGAPVKANDAQTRASLSGEQPPRLALVTHGQREPSIVVVWTAKTTNGTRLVSVRSDDGGKTFDRPAAVPGTDAPGNRGWESVAAGRNGSVFAVWLDHRELADSAGTAHTGHAEHRPGGHTVPATDGAARAELSKLFFARLDEPSTARPITGGVCYCCKTALTTGSDGSIYAAWRHVYPGNRRDIAFTMSRDAATFTAPIRISEDEWQLDGCPENGPAIAVDAASRIHVIWPTLLNEAAGETLALFYSMSRDGRSFSPRVRIPSAGPAYHPQVALTAGGELIVAWDELSDGTRQVRFARGIPGSTDAMTFAALSIPLSTRGSYPAIATTPTGIVAAWTMPAESGSRIAVAQIR